MSVSAGVLTPHAAPPLPQVVAIDLDEGLNGLVSYRMPVGMPRMDFLINSSSGVVVTTAELDRERIAEYQLRVVASDAGAPPKTSTSTLTIRGEGAGVPPAALSTWHGPWGSGRRLGAHAHHCCPLSRRHRLPCRWAPSSAGAIRHSRALSVSTKSEMPAGPSSHLVTAFRVPEPRGSGLDPLLRSPFLILAAAERACSGGGVLGFTSRQGRFKTLCPRLWRDRLSIWRCKGKPPLPRVGNAWNHGGRASPPEEGSWDSQAP